MDAKVPSREDLEEKVAVVVGTRPGIIKMSPIIKRLEGSVQDHFVIHAGQHYSYELDEKFFEDLQLPSPDYKLTEVKNTNYHGEQTAEMLAGIEEILMEESPRTVLVCGDANFNLAGALAARKLGMAVGHVEAGLRSDDWRMPEEHNRVIIDHISDYLFPPTDEAAQNAIEDNVKGDVVVTGNTIVDAVYEHLEVAKSESTILREYDLESGEYVVFTAHREENVDDEAKLTDIVETLERVVANFDLELIFPAHPRSTKMLKQFELYQRVDEMDQVRLTDPIGYIDFLWLLSNSHMVLTDSGGIQEEACILQIPCVTLRENTERPETVEVGANTIAGTDPDDVERAIEEMEDKPRQWENPFGDGTAADQIVSAVQSEPGTW